MTLGYLTLSHRWHPHQDHHGCCSGIPTAPLPSSLAAAGPSDVWQLSVGTAHGHGNLRLEPALQVDDDGDVTGFLWVIFWGPEELKGEGMGGEGGGFIYTFPKN